MTKPSERIVVFVTPAQKRAIAATADQLGISVSELMRRAVLSFGATSEQVKAASIVDRLNVPRAPDALDAALQRVARDTRQARSEAKPAAEPAPLLPADVLAALTTEVDEDAVATAEAVARVAAARAAAIGNATLAPASTPTQIRSVLKRPRLARAQEDEDAQGDLGTDGGHFA